MLENLLNYDFELAGSIILNEKNLVDYKINNPKFKSKEYAQVYAWVINQEIVYVGMASKGVQKRLSEHRGGWRRGSPTGIRKEKQIRNELELRKKIMIYARTCDYFSRTVDILGNKQDIRFTLAEYEEDVLRKKFRPIWNTNGIK